MGEGRGRAGQAGGWLFEPTFNRAIKLRQATTVLVLNDGGNWIDPLSAREHLHDQRIVDYYHAVEHLYDAARAARCSSSEHDSPRN